VVIEQAEVWWADLEEPAGSEPGYRRPVVVAQCNAINRSNIATVVCVPLTSNLKWADAPGNVLLRSDETGLPQDSVANVSLVTALDRQVLTDRVRKIPRRRFELILSGIDSILGR
jgi:mRNA interferase MazF